MCVPQRFFHCHKASGGAASWAAACGFLIAQLVSSLGFLKCLTFTRDLLGVEFSTGGLLLVSKTNRAHWGKTMKQFHCWAFHFCVGIFRGRNKVKTSKGTFYSCNYQSLASPSELHLKQWDHPSLTTLRIDHVTKTPSCCRSFSKLPTCHAKCSSHHLTTHKCESPCLNAYSSSHLASPLLAFCRLSLICPSVFPV